MKRQIIFLLLLATFVGGRAQKLSIDSCRTLALQYNKDKQSAALTTRQAEYTRKSTHALFFPELSVQGVGLYDTGKGTQTLDFNALAAPYMVNLATVASQFGMDLSGMSLPSYDIDYKIGWVFSGGLMLKQPIYMGGKIRAGYAMSKIGVEMARENERLTETQVILQTDEAYARVVRAEALVEVAQRYRTLLTELNRNVESAVRHGLRMKNDRMKVQVKMNEVELQLLKAQNGVRLAKMDLCRIIGQPLVADVEVQSEYPEVSDALSLQTNDVSLRPEIALLQYQNELAAHQVKVARSEMLPQIALLVKYGYTRGLELNNRTLLDGWNFGGGITVSIPLYHFGEHTNKVKAAQVKQKQVQLEQANKTELMLLELIQAANNLEESRLELNLASTALEQAEANMTLSGQQYQAGFETLSDYLEAQAQWQQAYETKVDAHFQLYLSSVTYLKAAGQLVR